MTTPTIHEPFIRIPLKEGTVVLVVDVPSINTFNGDHKAKRKCEDSLLGKSVKVIDVQYHKDGLYGVKEVGKRGIRLVYLHQDCLMYCGWDE